MPLCVACGYYVRKNLSKKLTYGLLVSEKSCTFVPDGVARSTYRRSLGADTYAYVGVAILELRNNLKFIMNSLTSAAAATACAGIRRMGLGGPCCWGIGRQGHMASLRGLGR